MSGAPPNYDSMYWQGPRVTVKQTGTRRKRGSVSLEGYGILGESNQSSPSTQVATSDKLGEFFKMAALEKREALDKLEDSYKLPVLLYYFSDFSIGEIGEVLEIPQGTVKSRLHKGREKLRAALEDAGHGR